MNLNNVTVSGNIAALTKISENKAGEPLEKPFLAVTVYHTRVDRDGNESVMVYKFTDSNGLLSAFDMGKLEVGRKVFLTGQISDVRNAYAKEDEVVLLKMPVIELSWVRCDLAPKAAPVDIPEAEQKELLKK